MNIEFYTKKYNCEYISSRSNPKIVLYSKLSDKKHRDEERLFLAEGVKLSEEAIRYADVKTLLVSVDVITNGNVERILGLAREKSIFITLLSREAFDKVSTEKAPQGIIAVVKYCSNVVIDNFLNWQNDKRILMLDEIRDPGNLGTILRSSEALGINGVILCNCADVYNTKTVRATMGTLYRLPIYLTAEGAGCVNSLKASGRRVLGAALGAHNLVLGKYETNLTDCIVIGNEGHGISDEILNECDACVKIPMTGNTESINAAQATACILWEYQRGM